MAERGITGAVADEIWEKLAGVWKISQLEKIVTEIPLVDINDSIDLPVGDTVTYTLDVDIDPAASGDLGPQPPAARRLGEPPWERESRPISFERSPTTHSSSS